ncbi:head-tail connector protein [Microvirga makkahensis]|uniref:Phage gp6-like head-tail connector protein n=1 Tax=Microvirga makkahensis TaxID=1128670 RepID=A0A7X3SQR6_9HYPH|nr:head-tail connector protein [Microvirga makkahensis]MXQ13836.1 hypothetical protein [Microvirga makkahensis]
MIPIFVDGPAVEPITLPEMKAYLRLDDDGQDDLLTGLIRAARLMVEAASRRLLIEQGWRVVMDRWPKGGRVLLPLSPVLAVDRVRVLDAAGAATDIAPDSIELDGASDPPCMTVLEAPEPGKARNGIEIELRAGYGATPETVPDCLKLAIKILVAHWFENRGDVAGAQVLPPDAMALVTPFQRARL